MPPARLNEMVPAFTARKRCTLRLSSILCLRRTWQLTVWHELPGQTADGKSRSPRYARLFINRWNWSSKDR